MDLLGADFPFNSEALAGRRALICGASGGIGAATARMMAKAGASVVVAARSVDKLDALVQELTALDPALTWPWPSTLRTSPRSRLQ